MIDFEKIAINIIYFINFLVPKKKNQVFFYSTPDFSDNSRAIYEELKKYDTNNKYTIIWAVKDYEKYKDSLDSVIVVKHRTIKNLWFFCRSQYIFRTHSLWGNKYIKGRQKMCIAWHGMPLKKLVLPNEIVNPVKCDLLISTAPIFDNELSSSMGLTKDVCKHVGLPRNDYLFSDSYDIHSIYPNYKRIFIWMPTFRQGKGYINGIDSELGIPCVDKKQLGILNDNLVQNNYLLILKLHPWSADKLKDISYSNIVNLKDCDIDINVSLYEIIGQTDALITDYSSIYIDYLLVNKPICFVYDDIEEYKKTRGFVFEPVEDYMPGEHITCFEDLLKWFDNFEKDDKYSLQRKRIKEMFYINDDNKSSFRVLKELNLI